MMRKPLPSVLAAALAAALLPCAHAEGAAALGEVTVQGVPYGAEAVALPSTIHVLDREDLTQGQRQVNLSESLNQVPGVVVNNRQDYAQDMQLSIRGFGADSPFGVQDVVVTLDGVWLTMPDGQGQVQAIDLPMTGGMKVIKGPFAALYGNAAGGVLEAWTRDAPERPTASLGTWVGGWGTHQTTASVGATVGQVGAQAGLSDFSTDGWRQHSSATRKQFDGVLNWGAGDDRWSLVANALSQDALDPGGLTAKELAADPSGVDPNMLKYDTRKTVSNRFAGLSWQHRFDAADSMQWSVDAGTRNIVQFLPMSGDGTLAFNRNSAGGVVALNDYFSGGHGVYTRRDQLAGRPVTLAAGVDYGREYEHRLGYANELGVQGWLRNDQYNVVDNLAEFVQAHWDLTPRLAVSGGVRHDGVTFGSTNAADALFSPGSSTSVSYGSTDPVVGVLWKFDAANSAYLDWGHGFVTPTFYQLAYRPDGQPGVNFGLKPMHLTSTELGLRHVADGVRVDASLFSIETDDQIVVAASNSGRTSYMNAGTTKRWGVDLAVAADLPQHLSTKLDLGLVNVNFHGGPYDGHTMPGAPREQLYAELSWKPPMHSPALQGFYTTVSMLARSQVWVDSQNSASAGGWAALNWAAGIEQSSGPWRFDEFLRIDNLLDRSYVGAVVIADANGRYYEAAPGRDATVGVQLRREF